MLPCTPLQMAADLIEHYNQFPDAFQFIKDSNRLV
jgi:hypothetical protein